MQSSSSKQEFKLSANLKALFNRNSSCNREFMKRVGIGVKRQWNLRQSDGNSTRIKLSKKRGITWHWPPKMFTNCISRKRKGIKIKEKSYLLFYFFWIKEATFLSADKTSSAFCRWKSTGRWGVLVFVFILLDSALFAVRIKADWVQRDWERESLGIRINDGEWPLFWLSCTRMQIESA